MPFNGFVTAKEAAKILGVSPNRAYQLLRSKRTLKIGSTFLWPIATVKKLLQTRLTK